MPKFSTADGLEKHNLGSGHYGYSAARITDLGATEYTLVTLAVDRSGSTAGFLREMEKAIKSVVQACKYSPRADNLMIRLTEFDDKLNEIHGFKLLENCNLADYDNILVGGGMTALYDAAANGVNATSDYGKQLIESDFSVNGIFFCISDGLDNRSTATRNTVRESLASAVRKETLESLVSVLIGVNSRAPANDGTSRTIGEVLNEFKNEAGFTQYVDIENADARSLAKLAEFVSKSISSQSQALGTGGPSKPLTF